MSRDEFYSVYPQTIQMLVKINRDHTTQTEVLDFSMLQNLGYIFFLYLKNFRQMDRWIWMTITICALPQPLLDL